MRTTRTQNWYKKYFSFSLLLTAALVFLNIEAPQVKKHVRWDQKTQLNITSDTAGTDPANLQMSTNFYRHSSLPSSF